MALLRTARLFAFLTIGGDGPIYTCPAGYRAVLRSIDVAAPSIDVGQSVLFYFSLYPVGEAINHGAFWSGFLRPESPSAHWGGQLVLNAGDVINQGGGVDFFYQGSGALMPLNS